VCTCLIVKNVSLLPTECIYGFRVVMVIISLEQDVFLLTLFHDNFKLKSVKLHYFNY
jgi:hypothetical protein